MTTPEPPDYQTLIDAETWAFIRETESWYPPETATFSVERQRQIYDAMCRAFHRGYPEGVTARDERLGGVPCRIYQVAPAPVTLVYFHGGGFVVGGLHSHDDVCAEICKATGFRVVSVDYRLAPEFRHPDHFNDAMAATRAVARRWPGTLLLAGDSAGANLAAAVSHKVRSEGPSVAGQILIYPLLGGDHRRGSYVTHAHAPMLTTADVDYYAAIRSKDGAPPTNDPTALPLQDRDFRALPPTVLFAAECDPLHDDAEDYATALRAAGGTARALTERGLVHGYLRARKTVARARASFERITDAISALGRGNWPFERT